MISRAGSTFHALVVKWISRLASDQLLGVRIPPRVRLFIMKKRILTGDRPTGRLHLGHYVGTLKNRVELQDEYEVFIIIADLHSLTTKPDKESIAQIKENTHQMLLDYLSVGMDPEKVTFYLQSEVAEVPYLAVLFSMLVSLAEVQRIPTLKEVMQDSNIKNPSLGLLSYPVLQAADILMVRANLVPVGKDQESHVELARKIARNFNRMYGEVFPEPKALVPKDTGTLVGTDGKAKMSKSLGNAIYLSDSAKEVSKKVAKMYTDPARVHATVPGKVEDNPVFTYHDAFNPNKVEVEDLKERYRKGEVKDVEVKEKLAFAINNFLEPIRARRSEIEKDPKKVKKILEEGTKKARKEASETLEKAKKAMGLV